jgi:cell division protein ZapA (FtsZ GTPase activity inhibitor)
MAKTTSTIVAHRDGKDAHIEFLEKEKSEMAEQHRKEIEAVKQEYQVRSNNEAKAVIAQVEKERDEQVQALTIQNRELNEKAIKDNLTILTLKTLLTEVVDKADKLADKFEIISTQDANVYNEWIDHRMKIPSDLLNADQ